MKKPGASTGLKYLRIEDSQGTEETKQRSLQAEPTAGMFEQIPLREFAATIKIYLAAFDNQAARLAALVVVWLALTAFDVMFWKLASATSAACLEAFCTFS